MFISVFHGCCPNYPQDQPDTNFHSLLFHPDIADKFFKWFDHMSWYPLGRPVGTTIYPGMQFTAVGIFHFLRLIGIPMSLNDVCCFVPAWFGITASIFTGLIARECSGSASAGAAAALVMSMIPAHMMRSVGGGYDNESIAVTAMTLTFYLWCRSLRKDSSWPIGILAGLAYFYMVAAWGGYVFVINMIAAHAGWLLLRGRFTRQLYLSYSLLYVIGTALAGQIPVVNWAPLKSMEQVGRGQQAWAAAIVTPLKEQMYRACKGAAKWFSLCTAGFSAC